MRKIALFLLTYLFIASSWAASMKSIVKDNVNVRSGPSTKHEVLYQATRGYPIQVEQLLGEWIRFKDWEGDRGWVSRALVSSTRTAVVLGEDVNVRRGPSIKDSVLAKVNRGEIYKVLQEKSGWFQLGYYDNNQAVGWIRKDLVWGP